MPGLYYRPVFFEKQTYGVLKLLAKVNRQSIKMFTHNMVHLGLETYLKAQLRLEMKRQAALEKQGKPRPRPSPVARLVKRMQDEWEKKRKRESRETRERLKDMVIKTIDTFQPLT